MQRVASRSRDTRDDVTEGSSSVASKASPNVLTYEPPRGPLSFKHKVRLTFEEPLFSVWAHRVSTFLFLVIIFSTICFILESEVCNDRDCSSGQFSFEPWADFFYWAEWFSAMVFAVEYFIRLWACGDGARKRFWFVFDWGNIVDLIAFLVSAASAQTLRCADGALTSPAHTPRAPSLAAVLHHRLHGEPRIQDARHRQQLCIRHRLRARHSAPASFPTSQGGPLLARHQDFCWGAQGVCVCGARRVV